MKALNSLPLRLATKMALASGVALWSCSVSSSPPISDAASWAPPAAAKIPLDVRDDTSPAGRQLAARSYDFARNRLAEVGMDRLTSALLLSDVTRNGMSDFVRPEDFDDWLGQGVRPSVFHQLCWRATLDGIRQELLKRNDAAQPRPPGSRRPSGTDQLLPSLSPIDNGVTLRLSRRAEWLARGMRDFTISCPRKLPFLSARAMRWSGPVRIGATGDAELDGLIGQALAEIRTSVPTAPIDDQSFPAQANAQNLFFAGRDGYVRLVDDRLRDCLSRSACFGIRQMMLYEAPARGDWGRTRAFLASAYLSSAAFGEVASSSALLELSPAGTITAALCGAPHTNGGRAEQLTAVKSCLAQAMGAYPRLWNEDPGFTDEQENLLWLKGLEQLKALYR